MKEKSHAQAAHSDTTNSQGNLFKKCGSQATKISKGKVKEARRAFVSESLNWLAGRLAKLVSAATVRLVNLHIFAVDLVVVSGYCSR